MRFLKLVILVFGLFSSCVAGATASAPKSGSTKVSMIAPLGPYNPPRTPVAAGEADAAIGKPSYEQMLQKRSLHELLEGSGKVVSASFEGENFEFTNAVLIMAPMRVARPRIMNFELYPKMTSDIKKFDYDPVTQIIEIVGEARGLRMHSWVKVNQQYWDKIEYDVVRGDLRGMHVDAYLWDYRGKTIAVAKGVWPGGRKILPSPILSGMFCMVGEFAISIASGNFKSYIEEEYKPKR